jgi:hypothetical protein
MSGKAGNHLFRNRKTLGLQDPSAGDFAQAFGELTERVIILCKEDICADSPKAPALDWSNAENGQIAIQLKDTEGLAEGNVTIKASTLQRIHPTLVPLQLDAEYLFPISLKTVVLQVQEHLEQNSSEKPKPVSPEFDTPISQVAREDEQLFRLERLAKADEEPISETVQAKQNAPEPILTPADRPAYRSLRERSVSESIGSFSWPDAATATPLQPGNPKTALDDTKCAGAKIGATAQNRRRRAGLERLREIFMTEDQLDARQVADLLAAFPKVKSALVMLGNGTVLGGNLPEGYRLETALLAPVIMQSVREFSRGLKADEVPAFTLLGERPVSLFAERNIYILISHEGRGLLPGMRERISEVAKSLDALCGETMDSIQLDGKG